MYLKYISLLFFLTFASSKISYERYKVYDVLPLTIEDVNILSDLQNTGIVEVWEDRIIVNHVAKVMVSPMHQEQFEKSADEGGFKVSVVIDDVEKAIEKQLTKSDPQSKSTSLLSFNWDVYHSLQEIYSWLYELEATYPDIVTVVNMGRSFENRNITGIIINYHPDRNNMAGMLEGGLHAREWISPATVTWIIKEFLTSTDSEVRKLAENFEWHIFPVVNPDGYSYTFTDNRMWRKNRNPTNRVTCAEGVDDDMAVGIDLNRNFAYQWMVVGATQDPCTNTYAGPSPASELETQAIAQYVTILHQRKNLIYYLAFHSYSQLIVVPYSHVEGSDVLLASNYADMYEIAIRGAHELEERFGTTYTVGVSGDVMYLMSGTSFDWVKYETNVPVAYLFELRDRGVHGFILPPEEIIPSNLEIMDSILEMHKTTISLGYIFSGVTTVYASVLTVIMSLFFILYISE